MTSAFGGQHSIQLSYGRVAASYSPAAHAGQTLKNVGDEHGLVAAASAIKRLMLCSQPSARIAAPTTSWA